MTDVPLFRHLRANVMYPDLIMGESGGICGRCQAEWSILSTRDGSNICTSCILEIDTEIFELVHLESLARDGSVKLLW